MTTTDDATPESIDAIIAQGEQAFMEGRLDDAEAQFRQALDHDGIHSLALNNLAVLLHQRGDHDGAELYLLRAAVLGREPSDALVNLAAIAQAEQNFSEAAAYLQVALAQFGDQPAIMEQMASLAEAMGDGESAARLRAQAMALLSTEPVEG
jgi:Flp pilus assembly protein TadD